MKKYIRTVNGFVLFPDTFIHAEVDVGLSLSPIRSAGFYHNGICFGESISLGIKSLPEDTEELAKWLS